MAFLRELRFGLRIFARYPSYGLAAVVILALGVGATTAVYSVLRSVLLAPLPYRDPARLVLFRADLAGYTHQPALTTEEFFALRERTDLFESVAAIVESDGNLTAPDDMAPLNAVAISDGFFDTLGIRPAIGRAVTRQDAGAHWSIDIGYELWQRHFHGDPTIVGREIEINDHHMTVAGVLPPGFRAYLGAGVYVPTRVDVWYAQGAGYAADPFRGQVVVARLRPDVSLEKARTAVNALAARLVAERPASYRSGAVRLSLSPLDREVVSEVRPALLAAAGAVAFVLLVACANVANLLLARASSRTRELAVRISIGASRAHLVRQLIAEGLVVAGLGAAGGLLLAAWGVDALLQFAPAALPRREDIALNGSAAAFAVVVACLCAVVVSLAPAWHAAKANAGPALKQDPASPSGVRTLRGVLAAAQLALSLMLLVGAGLMARAFVSLRAVPLGFEPRQAAAAFVSLQGQRFGTGTIEQARAARLEFYHQLKDTVLAAPGVRHAGAGFPLPLAGALMIQRFATAPGGRERSAEGVIALAGYLEALGVPRVAGRFFIRADDDQSVIVVDERLAHDLWPGESGVGKRLLLSPTVGRTQWAEVVGVAAHVQMQTLRHGGLPQIWMTYANRSYAQLEFVVRASHPADAIPALSAASQRLGSGRPIRDVRLLTDDVDDATADTRFALFVLAVFAAVAVTITTIGVYGVVAYATARRTREIAVRMALGADGRRIVALVMREGAFWTSIGLAAGIAGATLMTRYLEALLFGVGPRDVWTFALVGCFLAGAASVATALPALGAVRTSPIAGLRSE